MKLQQLRYALEVFRHDLNVSATAQALYTSQPGISKQIRLLEDELGVELFTRSGKHLTQVTPAGVDILKVAEQMMQQVEQVRQLAQEHRAPDEGVLSLATTHTQARYVLPPVITDFMAQYPKVSLQLQQGTPMQIAEMAAKGEVQMAIATEGLEHFRDLVMMPCYRWNRTLVVPQGHPLTQLEHVTLEDVAAYSLVTYVFGFTGRSQLDEAFHAAGLKPQTSFTAADADVIKTYVRLGLGVGIIAQLAFDPQEDADLVSIDASHLFAPSTTYVGLRRGTYMRRYMLEFVQGFAPHLTAERVAQALQRSAADDASELWQDLDLPNRD
jgi:LysR family cys regulon transcriptional activator